MKICVGSIYKAKNVHDQDHSISSDVQHYTYLHVKGIEKNNKNKTFFYISSVRYIYMHIKGQQFGQLFNKKNIPMYLTALGTCTVNYTSTLSHVTCNLRKV